MDCFPAQATALGLGIVTTTFHPHPHAIATATTPIHHLPHQPMSEPGPEPSCSSSYMLAGSGGGGHSNVNQVTKAEAGCSPIRYNKVPFNEVLI